MRVASLSLVLAALAAVAAHAVEIQKLKKAVKGQKEVEVHGHANFKNSTCESLGPPEIYLDEAPKGGTICMREGKVRLSYVWSGKKDCLGKRIGGVLVYYVPHPNFTGNDAVSYTVKSHDLKASRTYQAEIAVETGDGPAATMSFPPEPQKAGPMPLCAALVS